MLFAGFKSMMSHTIASTLIIERSTNIVSVIHELSGSILEVNKSIGGLWKGWHR